MAGEKYIVYSTENAAQIALRNILNPSGYVFLDRCNDAMSLLRMVRSYHPDFIILDAGTYTGDIRAALEAIDDETLCASILVGDNSDAVILSLLEKSGTICFCPRPPNKELLLHTVGMALMYYRRVFDMRSEIRRITENYEARVQVEKAKRILMERDGLSEKDAYALMRKRSMNERMSIRHIAELIIILEESGRKKGVDQGA